MKQRADLSLALLLASALATQPVSAKPLAIVHARVWTMQGSEPVSDATIVIDNGRIVSVTARGPIPAAARIPVVLDPEANMPQNFDQLGNRLDAAAILSKAGVKVAFGIVGGGISHSYNAGLELRRSAGLAVANGMPYADALRAITTNPAAIWDDGTRFGTLAPDAEADLVIWDGDPLEPSTLASTVIIEGRPVATDTRQKELQQRYYPLTASAE